LILSRIRPLFHFEAESILAIHLPRFYMLAKIKQVITGQSYLKAQWQRARRLGWVKFFVEAEAQYGNGAFCAGDYMAIASRETNLDPKWLTKPGDHGNGFGLMQADVRSFPEWIKSGKWRDAREGILMGARVLAEKLHDARVCELAGLRGKTVIVKSLKGESYSFIPKVLSDSERHRVSIAAYNCGRWAHYHITKGNGVDRGTTQKNYSEDVLERARYFRAMIDEWKLQNWKPSISTTAHQAAEVNSVEASVDSANNTSTLAASEVGGNQPPQLPPQSNTLKDFTRKYLRHTPTDSVKNVAGILATRIGASLTAIWSLGIGGKISTVLIALAVLGFSGWAAVVYWKRIYGWINEIFEGWVLSE
jgi:hypothetical protein